MKLRRSAKGTSASGSTSVTTPPKRRPVGPNAVQLASPHRPTRSSKGINCQEMASESPSTSVPLKISQQSNDAVTPTVNLESSTAKKRRLEDVFHRVCVICTNEEEDPGFPEADIVLKQEEELEKLATLLGSWKLNTFDPRRWTLCENCCSRLKELTSILDSIKSLETKVNQLADNLYIDVQKGFPANVEHDPDDGVYEVIYYRNQLFENRKAFALEAKPLTNCVVNAISRREVNNVGCKGKHDELLIIPDDPESDDWTEQMEIETIPHDFIKTDDNTLAGLDTDTDQRTDSLNEMNGEYRCNYTCPGDTKPCRLAFKDKDTLEIHIRTHTLEVQLGTAKNVLEQRGVKVYNAMLKQQRTPSSRQLRQCPFCGKGPLDLPHLNLHVNAAHRSHFYSCDRAYSNKRKCFALFSSQEEQGKHMKSCRKTVPGPQLEEADDGVYRQQDGQIEASASDESRNEHGPGNESATYPERVENDDMLCVICEIRSDSSRTRTAYIKHMLTSHDLFICIHTGPDGLSCLGALKSEADVEQHIREKHNLINADAVDLQKLYLDPKRHSTQCPTCGRKDLRKQAYIDHLREHGLFVCGAQNSRRICYRTFDCARFLELHSTSCRLSSSFQDLPLKNRRCWCRICKVNVRCKDRSEWLEHVKKHGAVPCNIYDFKKKRFCLQLFMSGPSMKSHVESEHPDALLNGDSPPLKADNGGLTALDLLKEGQLDVVPGLPQEGRFNCTLCEQVFEVYDQNWVDHMRSHGGIICGVLDQATGKPCLTVFYYLDRLHFHCMKTHERLIEGFYLCKDCHKGCVSLADYQKHQRLHGNKRGLICEKCGKEGSTYTAGYICACNEQVQKCGVCEKEFKRPWELSAHIAVEHEGRRETCKICGNKFRTKTTLRHHMCKMHGEGKAFACSVCKKIFPAVGVLTAHFKERHGEKNFKCDYDGCTWSFPSPYPLKKHIALVHEKLRPYVCDICGSTFKTKGHYNLHRNKHEAGIEVKFVREVNRSIRRTNTQAEVDSGI